MAIAPSVQAQSGAAGQGVPAGAGVGGLGLRLSPMLEERPGGNDSAPVFTESDRLQAQGQDSMTLQGGEGGGAQARTAGSVLKGDDIKYDRVEDEFEALGNVTLFRDGNRLQGPHLKFNMASGLGFVDNASFRIGSSGGTGSARRIELLGQNRMRAEDVTYTGCDCKPPSWWLKADSIDFDYNAGEGVGHNGVVYFKDVPILASPRLSFPLDGRRKSGFLTPMFGMNSKNGPEFSVPYYFNIAPNRDATLTTKYMGRRGLQLAGEFRYLEPTFSGVMRFTDLPSDRVTHTNRYLFSTRHTQQINDSLSFNWNYARVSDSSYFRDLSALGTGLASTATLEQSFSLNWHQGYWNAYARVVDYQTLQDPLAPIVPPYAREPQLHLTGARYDWHGFDVRMDADTTRFRSPQLVSGQRSYVYPTISYPIVRPQGFFIPKFGIHGTNYDTSAFNGVPGSTVRRTVPIMSVDTGLVFERDSTLLGQATRQTLEPRLFYLRVPYRNQSMLPVYDTALADFNFAQIFSDNLYSGWDRIAAANQLTGALTTRYLDPKTGFERAHLMVAQRFYFSQDEVTLPGETPNPSGSSDFLISLYGALTSTLSGETTLQYNPRMDRIIRSAVGARWSPQRLSTISVAYRYNRSSDALALLASGVPSSALLSNANDGQELIDIAFQWPLARNWYGIGRVNYSLLESRLAEFVAGIEYNSGCCWALRAVAQRYAVAKDNATTAMFLQLELTGFGGLGANPLTTLRRSIPGYQVTNPPPEPGTAFERYE